MKRSVIAILTALVLLGTGATVFAAGSDTGDLEVDGSFALATGPGSFDNGWGLSAGVGYMLNNVVKNLQGRIDIGYYSFSQDAFFATLSYTRVPITVSARYYFPIADQLKVFAQAGFEASSDSKEFLNPFFLGLVETKNELNLGLSPGAGIEFTINPQLSIFALGRFHAVTDSYTSLHLGAAYHF